MARRRFFVGQIHSQHAELNGEEAYHLTRVLRVERGQRFEISDNQSVYLAEVTQAHKDRVLFSVIERVPSHPVPVRLTMLAGLVKFDRYEWILEKGTELGVETFVSVVTARTEKGLDRAAEKRRTRWERIVLESAQQSRQERLPVVAETTGFEEALRWQADVRLLLDEFSGAVPLLRALPTGRGSTDRVAVMLGPEGGWTESERERSTTAGWTPVSLGPRILRSETAAVAAASLVVAAWQEVS